MVALLAQVKTYAIIVVGCAALAGLGLYAFPAQTPPTPSPKSSPTHPPTPRPTPRPTHRPTPPPTWINVPPECRKHWKCKKAGLREGNCCPTNDGTYLDCCHDFSSLAVSTSEHAVYDAPAQWTVPPRSERDCDDYMVDLAGPSVHVARDLSMRPGSGFAMLHLSPNATVTDSTEFLDEAESLSTKVAIAFTDFQTLDHSHCAASEPYDCSAVIRRQYELLLNTVLTRKGHDGRLVYHPAISDIVLLNGRTQEARDHPLEASAPKAGLVTALVSAFDGVLSAERAVRIAVDGVLPSFTISHSFASSAECLSNQLEKNPHQTKTKSNALSSMFDFASACLGPGALGYTADPGNDLQEALQRRTVYRFSTRVSGIAAAQKSNGTDYPVYCLRQWRPRLAGDIVESTADILGRVVPDVVDCPGEAATVVQVSEEEV